MDEVVDKLLLLLQPVGDVDLLLLLAAQGKDDVVKQPLLVVLVEFCLVAVLGAVAGAEEEGHGTALLAVLLRRSPLFDEGAHGGDAGAQCHHHQGRLVRVRHGHGGGVHAAMQRQRLGVRVQFAEPAGAEAHAVPAAFRGPLILDDAQVGLIVAAQAGRGRDGVQARLDVRHVVQQVADARLGAGELAQQLGVCITLLDVVLVGGLALPGAQEAKLLLLRGVRGAELQHLVEAALRPAPDVQHLGEELAGGDHLGQGH
mmetsp:Transcript_52355/g.156253  ORF Transcript_52355/g.156253 Transcript_52355/m.156253 type:complete len:258 (-) Transcript_52355:1478-2251(-)